MVGGVHNDLARGGAAMHVSGGELGHEPDFVNQLRLFSDALSSCRSAATLLSGIWTAW